MQKESTPAPVPDGAKTFGRLMTGVVYLSGILDHQHQGTLPR
jgi:hypothetical protein